MNDILLMFVPQWSPFQPPLSLPSLSAWLRRAGYSVRCVDANVLFYNWLLSEECAEGMKELLEKSDLSIEEREAYRAIFQSRSDFKKDLTNLKRESSAAVDTDTDGLYVQKNYLAIHALTAYLSAISEISGDFEISPYNFSIGSNSQADAASLEHFANDPPVVLNKFINWILDTYVTTAAPKVIGLSCIGEEQLAFTLLFGRAIKDRLPDIPILVGGTILSRIFERNIIKPEWFQKYFDVVVRNEGERPCELILENVNAGRSLTTDVPGIVYLNADGLCSTEPAPPLKPDQVPEPDFDDLDLTIYVCAEITLPVLSSRGCYWGKCEFCHHYMVYGEQYSAYDGQAVVTLIHNLSRKYNVHRFAFNDEAIPPRVITALGRLLPDHEDSGYCFTGLIKFEKYYKREHFLNLSRIGFRSLYIGLESASERVLALMKKPNTIETITSNLRDATEAGIWAHCFLFFGFPGETEEDAQQTFDFMMSNPDIIGSFGCGSFVLEHNAPIQRHLETFKLRVLDHSFSDVSVYYDYEVASGISRDRAREWMDKLTEESQQIEKYRSTTWIPREFLLSMISHEAPADIIRHCAMIDRNRGLPPRALVADLLTVAPSETMNEAFLINRMSRRVALIKNKTVGVAQFCLNNPVLATTLADLDTQMGDLLRLNLRPKSSSDPAQIPENIIAQQTASAGATV